MKTIRKGYKQTDIGVIPEDWNILQIKEFTQVITGGTPSTSISEYWGGDILWMSSGELNNKYIYDVLGRITQLGVDNSSTRPIPEYCVLIGLAGQGKTRGTAAINSVGLCTNQSIAAIVPSIRHNSFYLYHNIDNRYNELRELSAGDGGRGGLNKRLLENIYIPLPDIKEQSAIAEVLSDIDSLIEAMDKKIAKKRAIKEGAMQQLLIGKKRLSGFSKLWIEVELKEDLYFQPGHPFQSSYFNTDHNGLRLIRNRDLKSDDQVIYYNGIKLDDFIVENGDLLVSMDGDFSPAIWMKGTALLNQRVGRIRSKGSWKLQYFYYALIKPLQIIQNGVGATTVKHLSHNQVENMTLCIPSSRQEQQAIAQILTDMDDEIEQLEKQRAKYSYLKQGAMQKLLTGEIRLVKADAQPQKSAEIRAIPVSAHIVGGHIVNKLHDSKGWGRTKLQKSIHLVSYCCRIDVGAKFIRNTAGPDDQELMNHIDSKFKLYRQVDIETTTDNNGRKHYNYIPTCMIDVIEQAFENYPAETQKAANDLLAKIWKMDLARAEIVSTLYAVWNNRIIKKQPINNTLLLEDFYDWSEHKADFSQDLVLRALSYMNKEGIIPVGWGKYIDTK